MGRRRLGELMTRGCLARSGWSWQGKVDAIGPNPIDAECVFGAVGFVKPQAAQEPTRGCIARVRIGGQLVMIRRRKEVRDDGAHRLCQDALSPILWGKHEADFVAMKIPRIADICIIDCDLKIDRRRSPCSDPPVQQFLCAIDAGMRGCGPVTHGDRVAIGFEHPFKIVLARFAQTEPFCGQYQGLSS